MDKSRIIAEIKRTAAENGGKVLGERRFKNETGITRGDWYGKYWANWSEAVAEAGLAPNEFTAATPDVIAIEALVLAIRDLGRYPRDADLRMRRRGNESFPSAGVYRSIGRQAEVAKKVVAWCTVREGYEDVIAIAKPVAAKVRLGVEPESTEKAAGGIAEECGYVYLLKSGKYHKIGRTKHLGRRKYDIQLQLPEKATLIHEIQTDDPAGIEAHWHKRFQEKRASGEWFKLNVADVRAFRRWKRIY
jgi:hypothetical protein